MQATTATASVVAETMAWINDAFAACLDLQHTVPDPARLIYQLHWPIVDAIGRGDVTDARQAMLTHFYQLHHVLRQLGISERPVGSSVGGKLMTIDGPSCEP